MDQFTTVLLEQKNKYDYLKNICEKQLKDAPPGKLRVSTYKTETRYYHTCHDENQRQQYISTRKKEFLHKLAQKEYCIKMNKIIDRRLKQINRLLSTYDEDELILPYSSAIPARRNLIEPYILPFEEYAKKWESIEYPKRAFAEDDSEIFTEKGERVLSKSEKIIADKLYLSGIHYRYEYPLKVSPTIVLHPDFMLLHPVTRKEWIWEHMGMMDDEEYCEKALKRIELYAQMGYFPGVNLILTHESSKRPLNMRNVMAMLLAYGFLQE